MNDSQKLRIIKRPAYISENLFTENQYSNYLYNSKSVLIRLYAYLPFIFSLKHTKILKNSRILDLGCADGPLLPTLYYNFESSIAIDISENLTKESRKLRDTELKRSENVHILCADGQNLPFKDYSFDIVFCFEVLEHVRYPDLVIAEIFRILKDKGVLICTLPVELGPALLFRTLMGKILTYNRPKYSSKQLMNGVFLKKIGERPEYLGYMENIGELGHENFDWRVIFRKIKENFNFIKKKYIPINYLRGFNPFVFIKAIKKIK